MTFNEPGIYHWVCPPEETRHVIDIYGGRSSDGTPGEHVSQEVVLEPGRTYTFTVGADGNQANDGY
jgi:hypothetical protein